MVGKKLKFVNCALLGSLVKTVCDLNFYTADHCSGPVSCALRCREVKPRKLLYINHFSVEIRPKARSRQNIFVTCSPSKRNSESI